MKNLFLSSVVVVVSLTATNSFGQLGGLLKKAQQITEKASSVTKTTSVSSNDMIQPDACINNVKSRAGSIVADYYVRFKENPKAYLAKSGALWFPRKDFESARYVYTCGKEGYEGGRICEELAKVDPRYIELKSLMEDAEKKMLEMEKAGGYEFVSCVENVVLFKELKTGRVLSSSESNKV